MRLIVCLIALLAGCSSPIVRCDAHLQPINSPTPRGAAAAVVVAPGVPAQKPSTERVP